MRRLFRASVLGAVALTLSTTVFAQTPQAPPQPSTGGELTEEGVRPATTTASGTTGIWYVPTGDVLPHKMWSASFYRTNFDDGQGFTDVSTFPATFAVGVGGRAEIFGAWSLVTRIDRDSRPLFFPSTEAGDEAGTGGGIAPDYPKVREPWIGNKLGDLWVGGKINLLPTMGEKPAIGVKLAVKLPVGDDEAGASSGATDFQVDGIVSKNTQWAEISGYGGLMFRGNPDGYDLTNGFRWGFGAGFPQSHWMGLRITAELFGESYFDETVTAPPGLTGSDGSIVPVTTFVKSPAVLALGLTYQAPNGFFIGAAASWNMAMGERADAGLPSTPKDSNGLHFRIGYHPGVRGTAYGRRVVAPPPPPVAAAPTAPTPPPAPANRPPTVDAVCDPCTVEVGRTATVTANAQDPDGNPLTYQWTTGSGTLATPTARQSSWTAPGQPGTVPFTVTVNDGRGGTASDTVNIQVTAPAQRQYSFEDVHFEFDRFTLRPDALKVLDSAIAAMQENATLRLTIEGHTCNIGTAEYNLALGERRAVAVLDYLVSRGISADRLQTVSYGEERPKYDNSREETRRLNRRASLVVRLQ